MAAPKKTQYPPLPDTEDRFFNIAHMLRMQTKTKTMAKGWKKVQRNLYPSEPLLMAMIRCELDLVERIKEQANDLTRYGLLPFAWSDTTATHEGCAA